MRVHGLRLWEAEAGPPLRGGNQRCTAPCSRPAWRASGRSKPQAPMPSCLPDTCPPGAQGAPQAVPWHSWLPSIVPSFFKDKGSGLPALEHSLLDTPCHSLKHPLPPSSPTSVFSSLFPPLGQNLRLPPTPEGSPTPPAPGTPGWCQTPWRALGTKTYQ